MVRGTISPEEQFSKEHWQNSFGLFTMVAGVRGAKVNGVSTPKAVPTVRVPKKPVNMPVKQWVSQLKPPVIKSVTNSIEWFRANFLDFDLYRRELAADGLGGSSGNSGPSHTQSRTEVDGNSTNPVHGNKLEIAPTKKYLRDVEKRTGMKLKERQKGLLKDALRENEFSKLSPVDTAKHRAKFSKNLKDKLIMEWEEKTGQTWPRYEENVYSKRGEISREKGDLYDAHHIIENNYGGPHEWWNIHPARYPDQHQRGIHGKNSPASKLFPRR